MRTKKEVIRSIEMSSWIKRWNSGMVHF